MILPESALVPGNKCPELCGCTDQFGAVYAGPRCDGCAECAQFEGIKLILRATLPYKPCFITNHDHQMWLCAGCGVGGAHKGQHWYCPELTYRSGVHVSPLGDTYAISEDIPDEALEDIPS